MYIYKCIFVPMYELYLSYIIICLYDMCISCAIHLVTDKHMDSKRFFKALVFFTMRSLCESKNPGCQYGRIILVYSQHH